MVSAALIVLIVLAIATLYARYRPDCPDINPAPTTINIPAKDITFWYDLVYYKNRRRIFYRKIFGRIIKNIQQATQRIIIEMFLFNHHPTNDEVFFPSTKKIADALKKAQGEKIFIVDPINTFYGSAECLPLEWLKKNNVKVCIVKVEKLKDINLVYAGLWRILIQWLGTGEKGYIPHPMEEGQKVTLRSILKAINVHADHRKVLLFDNNVTMIGSGNLDDASSYNANIAVEIRNKNVTAAMEKATLAVARMSDVSVKSICSFIPEEGDAQVTTLFGKHIKKAMIKDIRSLVKGDQVFLGVLFLSDRKLIRALKKAKKRGVKIHILLDRNTGSFGNKKCGLPNQVVAKELLECGMNVRFFCTDNEQYHSKMIFINKGESCIAHIGSSNFTRLGFIGAVLEAGVRIEVASTTKFAKDVKKYIETIMEQPYSCVARPRVKRFQRFLYRLGEWTGLATW